MLTAALAAVTFSYAGRFRDRLSFAQAAVSGAPHSALAHRNLGVAYHLAGQTALARHEYEAAVAEDAGEPIVHNNLAVMLMAEGRLPEAEQQLRAELAVNPKYAVAHDNLARVLGALGRPRKPSSSRRRPPSSCVTARAAGADPRPSGRGRERCRPTDVERVAVGCRPRSCCTTGW